VTVQNALDLRAALGFGDFRPGVQHIDVGAGQEVITGPPQEQHTYGIVFGKLGKRCLDFPGHLLAVGIKNLWTIKSDGRREVRFLQ